MKQIRVIAFILVISWPGLLQEALGWYKWNLLVFNTAIIVIGLSIALNEILWRTASGNAAHKTTMKFTYDEQDSLGNGAFLQEHKHKSRRRLQS